MRLHRSLPIRRTLGLALATTLVAAGLAGTASAASPAGDVGEFEFSFRDDPGLAVLAVYPFSDDDTMLDYFRVKGPAAAWLDSHPLPKGTVGWRVIVKTAPTKNGPWTVDHITRERDLEVDKAGDMERFKNRTVPFKDRDGRLFVRVISRLIWHNEDGGVMGWVQHAYTRYGLALSSGLRPGFDDASGYRYGQAPNIWAR